MTDPVITNPKSPSLSHVRIETRIALHMVHMPMEQSKT